MIVRATGFVSAMATMMVAIFISSSGVAFAETGPTKDEAVAMVKKPWPRSKPQVPTKPMP